MESKGRVLRPHGAFIVFPCIGSLTHVTMCPALRTALIRWGSFTLMFLAPILVIIVVPPSFVPRIQNLDELDKLVWIHLITDLKHKRHFSLFISETHHQNNRKNLHIFTYKYRKQILFDLELGLEQWATQFPVYYQFHFGIEPCKKLKTGLVVPIKSASLGSFIHLEVFKILHLFKVMLFVSTYQIINVYDWISRIESIVTLMPRGLAIPFRNSTWAPSSCLVRSPAQRKWAEQS